MRPTVCGLPRMLVAGYPLVGGLREHHFDGANCKPRKRIEKTTPTTTLAPDLLGKLCGWCSADVAPAFSAGDRVRYPGHPPGRCVGQMEPATPTPQATCRFDR
jgi:hypothetical protein